MIKKFLLLAWVGYLCAFAHAQSCGPGSTSQSGPGWNTCVPIPGADIDYQSSSSSSSSPAVWEDRWGSIAVDSVTGSIGASEKKINQSEAEKIAISLCSKNGDAHCEINFTYHNQCVSVSQKIGGGSLGTSGSPKKEKAENNSIATCKKANDGAECHVVYSACSMPVRVQ